MSNYVSVNDHERTNHDLEIYAMRQTAQQLGTLSDDGDRERSVPTVRILEAAAALLEVHDATGISLDDWHGPRELVEYALDLTGFPGNLLENHV